MVAGVRPDMSATGQPPLLERRALCDVRYSHLVELVEELRTPVTLDRVVDGVFERLVAADRPPGSWHDLHEDLYRVDLPMLDDIDQLEVDVKHGLIDSTT
jgi:hypothetical protein